MIKIIFSAVAVIVVVLIVIVSMRPDEFRIVRSASISAPPAVVFAQVNDLHKWQEWSPWAKLDLTVKNTFEGPSAGTGAIFSWAGNNKVGEGRMTITESHPDDLVRFKLEFLKPFKANNTAEFTFRPEGNQTVVTWRMSGQNNFMCKVVGLFMNCDKMVGGDFEKGLASLRSVSEAAKKQ